jgi:transposase
MRGLTLRQVQQRFGMSGHTSYNKNNLIIDNGSSVNPPLISKKLTRTGGEKDWIT